MLRTLKIDDLVKETDSFELDLSIKNITIGRYQVLCIFQFYEMKQYVP